MPPEVGTTVGWTVRSVAWIICRKRDLQIFDYGTFRKEAAEVDITSYSYQKVTT